MEHKSTPKNYKQSALSYLTHNKCTIPVLMYYREGTFLAMPASSVAKLYSAAYIFLTFNAKCLFSGKSLVKNPHIVLHLSKNLGHIRKAVCYRIIWISKEEDLQNMSLLLHPWINTRTWWAFVHHRFLQLDFSPPQISVTLGNVAREGAKEDMDWDKEAAPGPSPRPRSPLAYNPDILTATTFCVFNSAKMR